MEFEIKDTPEKVSIQEGESFKIVIYSNNIDDDVLKLKKDIENIIMNKDNNLTLKLGSDTRIIPCDNILFFESNGNNVSAHTTNHILTSDSKLYELEQTLPKYFLRVSKSCILNLKKVIWYKRELSGFGKAGFSKTDKEAYISRMYYKPFLDKMQEMRGIEK